MKYGYFGAFLMVTANSYYSYSKGYLSLALAGIVLSIMTLIDLVILITQEEGE